MTSERLGVRESKKGAAREAIARAAVRLVVDRGLERVRVADIAAAAGVSPRTVNNYFSSKEEAIVWLAVERARRIVVSFRARPDGERLRDALTAAFTTVYGPAPSMPEQGGGGHRVPGPAGGAEWLARLSALFTWESLRSAYVRGMLSVERDLAEAVGRRLGLDAGDDLHQRLVAAAALSAERVAIMHWIRERGRSSLADVMTQSLSLVLGGVLGDRRLVADSER